MTTAPQRSRFGPLTVKHLDVATIQVDDDQQSLDLPPTSDIIDR